MEKIVEKYIELRDTYHKCMDKKEKGILTDEDSELYDSKMENFRKEAGAYYGVEEIDSDYALEAFNGDGKLQTQLMAYDINENEKDSKERTR